MTRAQLIALATAAIDPEGCRVCHARWEFARWEQVPGAAAIPTVPPSCITAKIIVHRESCAVVAAQTTAQAVALTMTSETAR